MKILYRLLGHRFIPTASLTDIGAQDWAPPFKRGGFVT